MESLDGEGDFWESIKSRVFQSLTMWDIIMSKVHAQQPDNPAKKMHGLFEEVECILEMFQMEVDSNCVIKDTGSPSSSPQGQDASCLIPDQYCCKFLGISPLTAKIVLTAMKEECDSAEAIRQPLTFQHEEKPMVPFPESEETSVADTEVEIKKCVTLTFSQSPEHEKSIAMDRTDVEISSPKENMMSKQHSPTDEENSKSDYSTGAQSVTESDPNCKSVSGTSNASESEPTIPSDPENSPSSSSSKKITTAAIPAAPKEAAAKAATPKEPMKLPPEVKSDRHLRSRSKKTTEDGPSEWTRTVLVCSKCKKRFTKNSDFDDHMEKGCSEKEGFTCALCNTKFERDEHLQTHMGAFHNILQAGDEVSNVKRRKRDRSRKGPKLVTLKQGEPVEHQKVLEGFDDSDRASKVQDSGEGILKMAEVGKINLDTHGSAYHEEVSQKPDNCQEIVTTYTKEGNFEVRVTNHGRSNAIHKTTQEPIKPPDQILNTPVVPDKVIKRTGPSLDLDPLEPPKSVSPAKAKVASFEHQNSSQGLDNGTQNCSFKFPRDLQKYCQPETRRYGPQDPIPEASYLKMKTGENPKQCPDCDKYFTKLIWLIRHMKTRRGCERRVKAPKGLEFSTIDPGTGEKRYGCAFKGCHETTKKLWKSRFLVHCHYSSNHKEACKLDAKCPLCDKKFLTSSMLKWHINHLHHQPTDMEPGIDPKLTKYCRLVVKGKAKILSSYKPQFPIPEESFHKMVAGKIPKQCPDCCKYFKTMDGLINHFNTKKDCDAEIKAPKDLVFSIDNPNTGKPQFGCNFEGCYELNKYLWSSARNVHIHITNEHQDFVKMDAQCHLCDKEFLTTAVLKMHLNEKHKDNPERLVDASNGEIPEAKLFQPSAIKPDCTDTQSNELQKFCQPETTQLMYRPSTHPFSEQEFKKMYYGEAPKQCPSCGQYFVKMILLLQHLKQSKDCGPKSSEPEGLHFCIRDPISNEKKYGCSFENCYETSKKLWKSFGPVHKHYAEAHKESCQFDFQCPVCEEKFLTMALLTTHFRVHKGKERADAFVRDTGEKQSVRQIILKRKLATSLKKTKKKIWQKSFPVDKKTYEKMRKGEIERECPKCKKILNSHFSLHKHFVRNKCVWHDSKPEIPENLSFSCLDEATGKKKYLCAFTNCPENGKSWSDKKGVIDHWLKKHSDHIKASASCPHCPKKFVTLTAAVLNEHIRIAHPETLGLTFTCTICGKSCKNDNSLKHHEALHKSKSIHCEFCDFKANTITKKNGHMRTMHPEKLGVDRKYHKCEHCQKEFKWEQGLKHHVKIEHTDFKPDPKFKCHICSKQLKQNNSYRKHMVNSHGVGERCNLCDKLCLDKAGLELHKRKFHEE